MTNKDKIYFAQIIITTCADWYNVPVDEVMAHRKNLLAGWAKNAVIWVLYVKYEWTFKDVALVMGCRVQVVARKFHKTALEARQQNNRDILEAITKITKTKISLDDKASRLLQSKPAMGTINDWPEHLQRRWRRMSARGGRNGSKKDKARAGRLGGQARSKNAAKQPPKKFDL